ncbi:MAG: HAD-IC family P-type ATPase, partial [Actinobacteria bacterium]|nr:HAD-IC family P-type ATPase [Actinomycetota bacterium]
LDRLAALGITVKVLTGDNPVVAGKVCAGLGLSGTKVATGADIDAAGGQLAALLAGTTVFARVSPEHKAQLVRAQRQGGLDVGFLGDGVNDALALHAADVGISVDSATDVAKDAADVLLLDKDLNVLADGVSGGRRIFANTMKYVLMGTSSNFGNMFSAAGASLFLGFLPLLPSQILLNNLLYDSSQLAIPTDHVDPEQLARPSRWDVRLIRRFMLFFGPISSVFDFITFGVMLWGFHAGPALFRSGWFVESLATQTLVIFAIRTRRVPFFRSHASLPLLLAALSVVIVGAALPATPLAATLGFRPLPGLFFLAVVLMVAAYLALIELGKRWFFRAAVAPAGAVPPGPRPRGAGYRIRRRAARFSTRARLGPAAEGSHPQRRAQLPGPGRRRQERGQRSRAGRPRATVPEGRDRPGPLSARCPRAVSSRGVLARCPRAVSSPGSDVWPPWSAARDRRAYRPPVRDRQPPCHLAVSGLRDRPRRSAGPEPSRGTPPGGRDPGCARGCREQSRLAAPASGQRQVAGVRSLVPGRMRNGSRPRWRTAADDLLASGNEHRDQPEAQQRRVSPRAARWFRTAADARRPLHGTSGRRLGEQVLPGVRRVPDRGALQPPAHPAAAVGVGPVGRDRH